MEITNEQAIEIHGKVREILQKYGNEEFGDCIIDEISFTYGFPTTTDVEGEYLCQCSNCGSVLYDENPQVNAIKLDVEQFDCEILPMELLNEDDGNSFYGCGNCETDEYLIDLKN